MKIKKKLLLGFAASFVMMSLLFGISIRNLNLENKMVVANQQARYQKIKYSQAAQDEINNISRYLRDLDLLSKDSPEFLERIDSIRVSRLKVAAALDSLEASAIRESTKKLISQIKDENFDYVEMQERCIALALSGRREDFIQVINVGGEERRQIFKYVEELNSMEDTAMNEIFTSSSESNNRALQFFFGSLLLTLVAGAWLTIWVTQRITRDLSIVTTVMNRFSGIREHVDLPRIEIQSKDEAGEIAASFNVMIDSLEEHARHEKEFINKIEDQNWLKTGIGDITALCQGIQDIKTLAQLLITKITPMVEANFGAIYVRNLSSDRPYLRKLASYAGRPIEPGGEIFQMGEGLVGQCALENRTILLERVPGDYIKIFSGLGDTLPNNIIIFPVAFEDRVVAVLELASLRSYSSLQLELLDMISKNIGVTIHRVEAHMRIETLLEESQVLTEKLQLQSEELQMQQEELRTFNDKLGEQNKFSEKRAAELEAVKAALEAKARQLEENSQYKTEFLSNMSHELRTPLNSLLILAQTLMDNKQGNLTPSQVEYMKTIFSSGHELLELINDILDLSKVEAGKLSLNPDNVILADIKDYAERYFLPVAQQKKLDFQVQIDQDLPESICMDEDRLLQILKNLLANAIKFTDSGRVSLHVRRAEIDDSADYGLHKNAEQALAFSVSDTGIGIPKHKQRMIFEAFQQANGTTARKYGGTGLGLSISQKLANLLGGYIDLQSVEKQGSTFTLYLPIKQSEAERMISATASFEVAAALELNETIGTEEGHAGLAGKKILVVDDDMRNVFALTTALENQQIKAVFAENGREGIEVLHKNPDVDLVLMDIMMPEMDGYETLRRIRLLPRFAALPIIALTAKAMKSDREKCIEAGASDYICKPVDLDQLFSLIKIWLYR